MPPRRIWIVGPCGAGKSSLARQLARATDRPVFHLDDLFWQPGWTPAKPDDFERAIGNATAGVEWIIDGNYADVRRRFMHTAELIVWLDLPLRVTFPRLLCRCARRSWRRELICNGNYEPLLQTLTTRESILWWALRTDHPRRVALRRELRHRPHVRLKTQSQIDAWLSASGYSGRSPST